MERIVIIGANEFQAPLIRKAKEMGFETHVFAWEEGAVGAKISDYFYPISIVEIEKIYQKCLEIQPSAITSIASDLAMITVTEIAHKLGLAANSLDCINCCTNKYLMRIAFQKAGIPTPKFYKITSLQEAERLLKEFQLPVIVKPTDRSGSRAITKLEKKEGLEKALHSAREQSFEKAAMIEEYLEGEEYSCETISFNGKHHILAYTKKYTTGAPHFIETGHCQPADFSEKQSRMIAETIYRALDALQISCGAAHTEFKIGRLGEIYIIETGARMGGDCIGSHLTPLSTGYDYLQMVIDTACNRTPKLDKNASKQYAAIRFILNRQDYLHFLKMKEETPSLSYVHMTEQMNFHPVVDSGSRLGFYIAAFTNRAETETFLCEKFN